MKVTYDFTGKVALVTGAASGIGRAMAIAFANAGANVAVCTQRSTVGQKVADEINSNGKGKAIFFSCNVCSEEDIANMKEKVLKEFGTVDFLISNAGISAGKTPDGRECLGPPFSNVIPSDWLRVFDVNLFGMVRLVQAFYDMFIQKKEGKIICTSSISAFTPSALQPQYSASKIAVINLVQSLSVDLGPHNINVNAICPGFVYTNMYAEGAQNLKDLRPQAFADCNTPEEIMNKFAKGMSAMQRPQSPEDMANAALFLASDASKEITGQYVCVDSGIVFR